MGRSFIRQVAWRLPHQHYGAAVERCARVQRRLLAGSGLGNPDASALRRTGLLGSTNGSVAAERSDLLSPAALIWREGSSSFMPFLTTAYAAVPGRQLGPGTSLLSRR